MSCLLKQQPNCLYSNPAKYICVSKQCRKPGFICEKGEQTQSQCWLFHENCTKFKWSEVQISVKENLLTKSPEFMQLQDRIQKLFIKTLLKIQSQHEKFKIWAKTYGRSLQMMKFIKVLIDRNYDQLTGDYMASMMPTLFSKEKKKIQIPVIIENDLQFLKSDIDKLIEKISTFYLKAKKTQKTSLVSDRVNVSSPTTAPTYSHRSSFSSNMSLSSNSFKFMQNIATSPNIIPEQYSSKVKSRQMIPSNQFRSKIIDSFSSIEGFFEGRVIKSVNLIYRASENNFSTKKFHQICDNIPDTLTLVHNEFGKKIGGYTPVPWNSDKKHWVADKSSKSFVFSVDMNERFNLNLTQFAVASNPQKGPTFGCCDICIVDNANKERSNCEFPISYNNGKYLRGQNTSNLFAGHPKGQFLIKDWEVFQLQFE